MVVAYEGTRYAGFQEQQSGLLTVQGVLNEGICKLTGESVRITGAGRTDSGVHANGQVVNFYLESTLPVEKIQKALNSIIPDDLLILSVADVPLDFHARYQAKTKTYSYLIHNHELRPLFNRNFIYHYRYPLDLELMTQASALLVGKKDFRSFQAAGSVIKNTIRTINFCKLENLGPQIKLEINADGFLYHMVRNIVGTLLLIGNGRLSLLDFEKIILEKDRTLAGPTAPACGLCLEEVIY